MSKILEEIKNRDETDIARKLYDLANDVAQMARNHLKRVIDVLKEFDIHDETHSEKIVLLTCE